MQPDAAMRELTMPATDLPEAAPAPPRNPFRRARGVDYVEYLAALHNRYLFEWYLEIGCRNGRSFAPVRGKTIAVDPFFKVRHNVIGPKPALHVFQQTSDDFFASGFLARNDIRLSFSFLDGMHLFEYLLRDFFNVERASDPRGAIAIHDCCPFSHAMTIRDHTLIPPRSAWTGDVWKLIPILQEYRPELKISALDCHPTGLVLVSNLQPGNDILPQHYDEIVARYMDVTLESWGVQRFNDSFAFVKSALITSRSKTVLDKVALGKEDLHIPTPVSL